MLTLSPSLPLSLLLDSHAVSTSSTRSKHHDIPFRLRLRTVVEPISSETFGKESQISLFSFEILPLGFCHSDKLVWDVLLLVNE